MLERIGKLLAAAEGAKTQQEAEAFFEKAQALASAHAISLAEAAVVKDAKTKRETPIQEHLTIGTKGSHVNKHLVLLMSGIAGANDVKMDIAHNSTYVVLFGMPSDIEVCKLLWTNISTQMIRLGDAFIREGSWRGETVYRVKKVRGYWGWEERWGNYPVTAQSVRASYYNGFTTSLKNILITQREEQIGKREKHWHEQADVRADATANKDSSVQASESPTAIALRQKEVEVKDFYSSTSDARGSWRPSSGTSFSRSSYRRGHSDASKVRVSAAKGIGGGRKGLGA